MALRCHSTAVCNDDALRTGDFFFSFCAALLARCLHDSPARGRALWAYMIILGASEHNVREPSSSVGRISRAQLLFKTDISVTLVGPRILKEDMSPPFQFTPHPKIVFFPMINRRNTRQRSRVRDARRVLYFHSIDGDKLFGIVCFAAPFYGVPSVAVLGWTLPLQSFIAQERAYLLCCVVYV